MKRLLAVPLLALVCTAGVYAQSVSGSGAITGIVRDIYGDGIPEVTVTLTNPSLGITRTMITSDDGLFAMPGLVPSPTYVLKATKKTYGDWQLKNFDVSIGETVNFRVPLVKADASATQSDPLSALTPVQDTKMALAALITEEQLRGLPVAARLIDSLVLLAPAVSIDPNTGVLIFRGQESSNSILVDGLNVTNTYYQRQPGVAPFLSLDAMQEMQVISAGASAEFGYASGGIMNIATHSGTNSLHVGAYDFYNSHSMNTEDRYGNGFKPTGDRQQGGVNFGAPVAPDKFFVYGNFELLRVNSQGLNRITNPLLTDSTGNNVLTSNCTATTVQCAQAAAFIKSQLNVVVPRQLHANTGFAKIDFRPGDRANFTVDGGLEHRNAPNGVQTATVAPNNQLLGQNGSYNGTTEFAKFGYTAVVADNAENELRLSYYKDTTNEATNFTLAPSTGPVAINVAGTPIGTSPKFPANLTQERIGGVDSFTLTIASNTIKLGVFGSRNQDRMDQLDARYGEYYYGSLTAFANDFSNNVKQLKNYSEFFQTFGNPVANVKTTDIHAFVHDTWKPTSRLLINGGLRWEKTRIPGPPQPNPLTFQSRFIPTPNTNYGPRIGVAYLLDSRTVLRAGAGEFFEPYVGQMIHDLTVGGGVYQTSFNLIPTQINAPVFPKALPATTTVSSALINQLYAQERFRDSYVFQGSVGAERRLNSFMALAVSYVESRGKKLWSSADQNLLGASNPSKTYTITDANGVQTGTYSTNVFATNFAQKVQVENAGSSKYKGAVAQLRTALSHGLSVQASYTWSHTTDDIGGPTIYGGVVHATTSPGLNSVDTANSALDQRNRGVINWTWQPRFTGGSSTTRLLADGWQLSGIASISSTMHDTPLVIVNGQQFASFTMAQPTSLNGSGGWNRVPFLGINSVPIGSQFNLDVRLTKVLAFTERLKATFLVEAFNATNHSNETGVQNIAYSSTLGVLRAVPGLGTPNSSYNFAYGTNARRVQLGLRIEY